MQASELADSLYKQELISKVAGTYTKDLREQAKLQEQKGNLEEANRLNAQAAAIEQGIVEGKSLEQAQKSVDAQQKFNLALERAKEIFTDVVDGGLLDGLVDALEDIVIGLERLGFGNREARLNSELQKAVGTQKSQGNRLNKEAFSELQAVANTTPTFLGKLFGVEGAFKEGSFDYVTKEEREAAQARIRELTTAESTIRTAPTMATATSTSGTSTMTGPNIPNSSQVTVNLVVDSEKLASTFQSIPMK
jgi:DNA gyrase/topoisomerase IV subunit A